MKKILILSILLLVIGCGQKLEDGEMWWSDVVKNYVEKATAQAEQEKSYEDGKDEGTLEGIHQNPNYLAGYAQGFADAFPDGEINGEIDGINDGIIDGQQDGYDYYYKIGYDVAYKKYHSTASWTFIFAKDEGEIDGRLDGQEDGYDDGHSDGYNHGHEDGYDIGLSDATSFSEDNNSLKDLEKVGSGVETAKIERLSQMLESRYEFSNERANEAAKTIYGLKVVSRRRQISKADAKAFTEKLTGISLDKIQKAYKKVKEGRVEEMQNLIETTSINNGTSPEAISQMISDLFLRSKQ